MNAVHFCRPAKAVGRCKNWRPAVSSLCVPIACRKGDTPPVLGLDKEWSLDLPDCDLIEIVDIDGLSPEEPLNPFQGPASDFDSTEKDAEDTFSIGLDISHTYGRSGGEEDDDLPNIEEFLSGVGKPQAISEDAAKTDGSIVASPGSSEGTNKKESVPIADNGPKDRNNQDAQREADGSIDVQTYNLTPDGENKEREAVRPDKSIGTQDQNTRTNKFIASRKQKSPFKIPPTLEPNDWDNRAILSRKEPGSPGGLIVVQDQNIDSSSDGVFEKQNGNQGSLSTPLTSVEGSDAGYSTLDQKNKHNTLYTSPLNRNIPSSTLGKRTRGLNGGNREGPTPDPLTDGDKKIPCNGQEAEADDKKDNEEKYIGDGGEKIIHLGFIKERGPFAVERNSASKHSVKRRRYSSPILAVHNQNHDTQDDGTSPETEGA
ncbi:hypothetical protein MMC26_007765 [Xylographa opegraphella]|nr:hypothetical protein [Xylographa opegraphella]